MAKELTKKMKDFADAYMETGNIYQSAIRAGYSENYAKGNAQKLFENVKVQKYIEEQMESIQSQRIASIQEVMEYLTRGIRQELEEEVIVVEGCGDGCSDARKYKKKISIKDSNKCAELLGRRFGIFSDKMQIEGNVPVVISGGDQLAD